MAGQVEARRSAPCRHGRSGRYGHAGAVFGTEAEYRSLLHSFVTAGIQFGERICCLVSSGDRLRALDQLAAAGLNTARLSDRGQLLVMSVRGHHLGPRPFEPAGLLAWAARCMENAAAEGFSGFRIMLEGNSESPDTHEADDFEMCVDRLVANRPGVFLCAYDRRRCGAKAHRRAAAHRAYLDPALSYQDEVLRILPAGGGIRIIGRIDVRNRTAFLRVLAAVVDRAVVTRTDVHLEVHELTDPDGPAVAALAQKSRQLSAIGLSLVLCAPSASTLRLASVLWDDLPTGMVIEP